MAPTRYVAIGTCTDVGIICEIHPPVSTITSCNQAPRAWLLAMNRTSQNRSGCGGGGGGGEWIRNGWNEMNGIFEWNGRKRFVKEGNGRMEMNGMDEEEWNGMECIQQGSIHVGKHHPRASFAVVAEFNIYAGGNQSSAYSLSAAFRFFRF